MPIESIIVSALVVAVFSTFGIALAYAERQTATSRADRNALAGLLNPSSTGRKRRSATARRFRSRRVASSALGRRRRLRRIPYSRCRNPHRSPPRCPRQPNCDQSQHHRQGTAPGLLPRTLYEPRPQLRGEDHNGPVHCGGYPDIQRPEHGHLGWE